MLVCGLLIECLSCDLCTPGGMGTLLADLRGEHLLSVSPVGRQVLGTGRLAVERNDRVADSLT